VDTKKKLILGIGFIALAIGGFALTKYLTRNTKRYKYNTIILPKEDIKPMSSEDVE
jgi:hypothetical protein